MVATWPGVVNRGWGYYFLPCAGESSGILVDSGRRDPESPRPGTHGRGERPGLPPPGPALWRRAGLLGDGELRRPRAPERADAGLPAGRPGRAPPGDPDLRLRAARDGGGGADGRGRRCGR